MDPKTLFAKAVDQASSCVRRAEPTDMHKETPCSDWDLHALLNHMVYELRWLPDLLRGKTIAEVGTRYDGDLLGSDPLQAWQHAVDTALVAIKQCDEGLVVELSYGKVPAKDYIAEAGRDMLIHGWDVGQALNCSLVFDHTLAEVIYKEMAPQRDKMKASGMFGEDVDVPENADTQTKLLAVYGRSTQWGTSHT